MPQIQQAVEETQQLERAIQLAQQSSESSISPSDLLAMERTKLANERTKLANVRTLLAYIRTSLTFFAAAATLIQFFKNKEFVISGYVFIPLGVLILLFGLYSYFKSNRAIKDVELIKL
jgi:putative membrane protein